MTRRFLKATRSDLTYVKNGIPRPTAFTSASDIWKIETIIIDRITRPMIDNTARMANVTRQFLRKNDKGLD